MGLFCFFPAVIRRCGEPSLSGPNDLFSSKLVGLVLYSGVQTKLVLNSKKVILKRSRLDLQVYSQRTDWIICEEFSF